MDGRRASRVTQSRGVDDELWAASTRHPFLDAVRNGTITDAAFDRWLAQDALFVGDLLGSQAQLLARAPRHGQAALASGCAALVAELGWFETHVAARKIDPAPQPLPATLAYRALLQRLDHAQYGAAVTELWVIERVFLLAWTTAESPASPFAEFVEHWTTSEFADYVDALGALAQPELYDDVVRDVLAHEVAFWDMAL